MNKVEFLLLLQTKRSRLMKNLAELDEAVLNGSSKPNSWSIKDGLAHLTFYEQHMLNNVRRSLANDGKISGVTLAEQSERNAKVFNKNKDRSLDEIVAEMESSFAEVLAFVETIPEATLIDPNHFGWLNGMPLWQYMLDETSGEHFEEHLGSLMGDYEL